MTPRPTDAELKILRILWMRNSPSTVRQIHEDLARQQRGRSGGGAVGYTTVLKLLQIMTQKGLVVRDESQRTHSYRAGSSEDQTQQKLVRDLIARAFGGSAQKLVLHALDAARSSPAELAEIRKVIDQMNANNNSKESRP